MALIRFEDAAFGTSVYVNPEHVAFVTKGISGFTLHSIGGESVTVRCEDETQLIQQLLLEYPHSVV